MKNLYKQVVEKRVTQMKLDVLEDEIASLTKHVEELEEIMLQEQEDVDRLKKVNFKNLMMAFSKDKEARIEKERKEADEATQKYERAMYQLHTMNEDKQYYEQKIESLKSKEEQYEILVKEKVLILKEKKEEVVQLVEKVRQSNIQIQEIREAIEAGKKTLHIIEEAMYELNEANSWVDVDYAAGTSGSDSRKYKALRNVEILAKQLQKQLITFKKELAKCLIVISVSDFINLNNFVFSKMIGSYSTVKGQIINAQVCFDNTKQRIEDVVKELKITLKKQQEEYAKLQDQLAEYVIHN